MMLMLMFEKEKRKRKGSGEERKIRSLKRECQVNIYSLRAFLSYKSASIAHYCTCTCEMEGKEDIEMLAPYLTPDASRGEGRRGPEKRGWERMTAYLLTPYL